MRIALATDAWSPQINGVVRTLSAVTERLQGRGHEVLVIGPERFRTIPCPSYPEIRLALRPQATVGRLIEAFRPEAVHVATEGPIGLAARRYCLRRGRSFTTSLHTRFPEYVRMRLPFVPLAWGYRYLRWFHGAAARTMVAVPSLKHELESRGFEHLSVWSRGVDLDIFRPRDGLTLQAQRPVFMYLGRVAVEKSVHEFLELALDGTKVVVGDGPDRVRLARSYPQAQFTGYKVGVELAQHLTAADVLVFPSRTDTFGLVILEAMACGVPVAAYPVQGPADLIENGVNGYVDDDLRRAALACLSASRDACREFAAGFSWDACTDRFLEQLAVC